MSLPAEPPPGIALFDLDGTLIPWDCQLLFRHHVVRREPWRRVYLPVFLGLLPFYPILKTEGMKRVFLSYLRGMSPEKVAEHAESFASSVMPAIYPGVRAEIERHRRAGHLVVLTSASPEFYVSEIGRLLGFDLVLGTVVTPGELFPDLENHKGAAKVARLRALLPAAYFDGAQLRNCHGYTDSTADLPMLELCQQATLVNPKPELLEIGTRNGWQVVRPARPWKAKADFIIRSLKLLFGIGEDPGGLRG
ncbi:HAD family hydrolase [Luteolibacter sp. SL250]|uniref:HAD family hydrolase n=1 Tax=Luteolibacter sp. SL250 TaxID=2995170 RepID=UPI002271C38D|nr:HAD family hydrolase [Luteolibacter sp. SL250]WAC19828.1 HAD family hydrolase [Luteolibacter sp. SL250]